MDPTEPAVPLQPPAASRRAVLYGGVAIAAAAAGAGAAWWRFQPRDKGAAAPDALWGANFETPEGAPLAMQSFRGKSLLLNFWATWCPPCVEELPLIDSFFRANSAKSWQVVGLAIDQPSAVRKFLARTPVSFPVALAGLEGTELGKILGNEAGGLPFSIVVSAAGSVLHRRMGRLSAAELVAWGGAA
jgi:thiol-disulfide isomerase/thioredoxin